MNAVELRNFVRQKYRLINWAHVEQSCGLPKRWVYQFAKSESTPRIENEKREKLVMYLKKEGLLNG